MLALVCIIFILTSNGDSATILNLVLPLVSLVGSKHAIHIDGARCVRKVEAAISRIELRYRTGELVVRTLVCKLDEFRNGLGLSFAVVFVATFTIRIFKDGGVYNLMLFLGSIILILTGNGDSATILNLVLPFIRLVGIQYTEHIDGARVVREIKTAIGFIEFGDLTSEFIVFRLIRELNEFRNGLCFSFGIVIVTGRATFALAVEAIDEATALAHGFRSIALEVNNFTADNHFIAFLNIGVAALPLTVAQIISLVYIEALATVFIDNVECCIAIGAASFEGGGHLGYLALEEDIVLAGLIGREGTGIFQDTGHIERILQGTVTVVNLSFRTGLVDGEAGTGEADGEHDGGRTVVFRVLRDSDFNRLGLYCGLAGGCAEGDPIRDTANSPVTGGRDRYGLGATGGLKRERCLVQSQLGRAQVHFFVTADEHCCASYNCHKEVSEFHTVIFKIVINAYVLKYKYTTFFRLTNKKARGSVEHRAKMWAFAAKSQSIALSASARRSSSVRADAMWVPSSRESARLRFTLCRRRIFSSMVWADIR